MLHYYPAVIDYDTDTGAFGIVFPDFPGCVSAADSVRNVGVSGAQALQGHVDLMIADNDRLPEPSDVSSVKSDEESVEVARVLVPVRITGQRRRYNVSLDRDLVAAIDDAVGERGRSGFLEAAARRELSFR